MPIVFSLFRAMHQELHIEDILAIRGEIAIDEYRDNSEVFTPIGAELMCVLSSR
eukprot:m.1402184 g.1402184  ORF g.1402184 m.1402184 type:complete len:54 (+) comp25009_c0_seq45:3242-3403(+)